MNPHLSEQELAEWLTGRSEQAESHFGHCPVCRAEAETLRAGIQLGRKQIQAAAQRDEAFWTRQRWQIREGMTRRRSALLLRRMALLATAVVLCAWLLLNRSPQPAAPAGNDEADSILLQQVQSEVAQDYPSALAPAVLLSQERAAAQPAARAQ